MRIGSVRVLTYPMDGWGTFYAPIGPQPTATLLAGLRHIAATPRDWDLVDLRWVDADGLDKGRTRQALRGAGLAGAATAVDASGPDRIVERLGSVLVEPGARLAARSRSIAATARLNAENWNTSAIGRPEHLAATAIRGGTYTMPAKKSRGGVGKAHRPTARRSATNRCASYLRDAHESAAAAGGVDLNLLRIDGRPAAFAYNYHFAGQVYGLRAGFDPAVAPSGSGTVLLRLMVEDSFRRGDERIDLGPDSLEYKRRWATQNSNQLPLSALRGRGRDGPGVAGKAVAARSAAIDARLPNRGRHAPSAVRRREAIQRRREAAIGVFTGGRHSFG